ncbi:MAG: hypothetical protein DHS80DRAFT_24771 [Piptocephalis tieghemiana]|nr:MAG: hypothetical protein DHS80DRAFT_24771 [Piptocephalis tieghemiana]
MTWPRLYISLGLTLLFIMLHTALSKPIKDIISPAWGAPLPYNNAPSPEASSEATGDLKEDERVRWDEEALTHEKPPPDPRYAPLSALSYSTNSTTPPPTFVGLYNSAKDLYRERSFPFPGLKVIVASHHAN